ncbi:T6SS immunity protein Tdi1 domain-containing protein [Paenibacillus amylolyticus]|uniref:T6SS immunity protein Tdi1 domain-containing protein n=1 Tax=Paenibacillus amylolyticus TaxID=1451 RepID=UPI000B88F7D7|nr:T6SS immunity protein Tdi1 domain-containing protein [Paenibacillus amylolyticus]
MPSIPNFVFEKEIPISIIEKYRSRIPVELIEVWKEYGMGSLSNGYLKIINPDQYLELLQDTYSRAKLAIPLFTTAMGDILIWEDGYLMALNFRKHEVNVIGKNFKYFFGDISDEYFLNKALDWSPYLEAFEKYGEPAYDECFGYVPLLGLGGAEKVENLKKVKFIEHIYIINHFMGPME